jgi:very-short-patch-repair endonuclease
MLYLAVGFVVVVAGIVLALRAGNSPVQRRRPQTVAELPPAVPRVNLLTRYEAAFLIKLEAAVRPDERIFAQVQLSQLFDVNTGHPVFKRTSQKTIDFILCDRQTTRILLAIELDDRTHDRPNRAARDEFVNELLEKSGIPLLRFRHDEPQDPASVTARIRKSVKTIVSRRP